MNLFGLLQVSGAKFQPHTPKQGVPGDNFRPREQRLKASAIVKKELSEIFEDIYDAWMFMDTKCSLSIHPPVLSKGLERLGISVNVKELVQELDKDVYDGNISVREFIKGLTWHEVPAETSTLNRILDSAMLRRDATVEHALRTAAWRNSRRAPKGYVPSSCAHNFSENDTRNRSTDMALMQ